VDDANLTVVVDENFPAPATRLLRQAGHTIIAVSEVSAGISDEAVLQLANTHHAWLVTFDLDFGELVFQRGLLAPRALVILRESRFSPTDLADVVGSMLGQLAVYENKFVIWSRERIRTRPLPKAKSS
jgi:predicted nuclease of predicted toxin-antitoxin system